jgi:hypothetical protein
MDPATVESYFRSKVPAAFVLSTGPVSRLTIDPPRQELRLITPAAGSEPDVTAYERIGLRRVTVPGDDREWFEIAVDARDMHYEAYVLIESIVDRLRSRTSFRHAVSESMEGLKDLLMKRKKLTDEKVTGLIGELLVLEHVIVTVGESEAVGAWLGPHAEQHDFGFEDFDAEVKTTLSEARSHIIGSETQLEPVKDRPLYLVSIQLTRAGSAANGFTLPEAIARVRALLDDTSRAFDSALDELGWSDVDSDLYSTRFELRSTPQAYLVDDEFPAITSARLDQVVPQRPLVGGVSYRVDVTHLDVTTPPPPLSDFCKENE